MIALATLALLATTTSVCSVVDYIDLEKRRLPGQHTTLQLTVPMSGHKAEVTTDAEGRACFDVPMSQARLYTLLKVKKQFGAPSPEVELCVGDHTPLVHFTIYAPFEGLIADCFYPNGIIPETFKLDAGTVHDANGNPIANADLLLMDTRLKKWWIARSDRQGRYHFPAIPFGYNGFELTVRADGFYPRVIPFRENHCAGGTNVVDVELYRACPP